MQRLDGVDLDQRAHLRGSTGSVGQTSARPIPVCHQLASVLIKPFAHECGRRVQRTTLGSAQRTCVVRRSPPAAFPRPLFRIRGIDRDREWRGVRRLAPRSGARILIADEPGSQIAGELLPDASVALDSSLLLAGDLQLLGPREVAMYKPRWGAFFGTPLERHLREQGVSTLVFAGCNFPNCPRASIYEASERDFRVVLARDAISGLYERGERELLNIGVQLMSAREVAGMLSGIENLDQVVR